MAAVSKPTALLPLLFFFLLLCSPGLTLSQISPSPAPNSPSPSSISVPPSPSPSSGPISPSPANPVSPPAPMIDESSPASSSSPTPSPVPAPANDVVKAADASAGQKHQDESSSGGKGMSGGKKAGIAIGVLFAAAIVGFALVVYKKRQDNIQRSRYGYNARMMEMI